MIDLADISDIFLKTVGVDGAFAYLGAVCVYCRDGASEELGYLGAVVDAYPDQCKEAEFGVEKLA